MSTPAKLRKRSAEETGPTWSAETARAEKRQKVRGRQGAEVASRAGWLAGWLAGGSLISWARPLLCSCGHCWYWLAG